MIMAMSGGSQVASRLLCQVGQTISIGSDRYLIVYRAQPKAPDAAAGHGGDAARYATPEVEHLSALTPLSLSLLNLHQNPQFC